MANPILVTGVAGRVGAVGRTVAELLLKQGKAVRAMVRTEDERAQATRSGCGGRGWQSARSRFHA
jgi:nucleoside-diphosphate-sugar epimerase